MEAGTFGWNLFYTAVRDVTGRPSLCKRICLLSNPYLSLYLIARLCLPLHLRTEINFDLTRSRSSECCYHSAVTIKSTFIKSLLLGCKQRGKLVSRSTTLSNIARASCFSGERSFTILHVLIVIYGFYICRSVAVLDLDYVPARIRHSISAD